MQTSQKYEYNLWEIRLICCVTIVKNICLKVKLEMCYFLAIQNHILTNVASSSIVCHMQSWKQPQSLVLNLLFLILRTASAATGWKVVYGLARPAWGVKLHPRKTFSIYAEQEWGWPN